MNKKKYRIGIDARMYGPKQTGIGTYIKFLIKELSSIDKKNDYFIFLLPEVFKKLKFSEPNFHKVKVTSHWYSLSEQTFFLKELLSYKLDLVHFTHFNLPILYPRKFIVTIHDITPKFSPGHKMGKKWWRRKAYDLIVKKDIEKASVVITPSLKTKKDLINFYKGDKSKIKIIYEGIKDKKNPLERQEFLENYTQRKQIALQNLKSKFNFSKLKQPYIFYTGVWRSHKNLVNLIRAFNILVKERGFKGQLVLGGNKDPYYPEAEIEIKKLGLTEKIITPGFLLGEKLNLFYQAAEVFVLPSFYEGFGLVALEALNQGTTVACSDIEPLREILQDSALYFKPDKPEDIADKMYKITQDKRLQKKLLTNSQKILERYDWFKMTQRTHDIYMKTLKNN